MATVELDVKTYIDAFGGKHRVMKILWSQLRVKTTLKQVEKWLERNSIPGSHLVALQILAATQNPQIEILNHVELSEPDQN